MGYKVDTFCTNCLNKVPHNLICDGVKVIDTNCKNCNTASLIPCDLSDC